MLNIHRFFNFGRKYKIRFYPFGDARILEQIKKIKPGEVTNTILLLDAFDEDKKLNLSTELNGLSDDERFRRRLDEIIETVRDFREVVITSRTQYFPGQENQPYELKIPRFDEKGFHKLAKFYLSPFDSKEITRYLNKKYGVLKFWNQKKKQIATTIINNSPKLMVRPMLLSYIDFLVESKQEFKNTYQIYETLVDKWIEREANKRKPKTSDCEKFKKDLHKYSQLVAVEIYRQRTHTDMLSLKKDAACKIVDQNNLGLSNYEITGQSLLTRDAEGNWKFAHKSILEFLLAKEAVKYIDFWNELAKSAFAGMDMARLFYEEVGNWVLVEGGTFIMGDENGELSDACRPAHQVTVPDFFMGKTPVTQKQWGEIMGTNPSYFEDCGDCPVENVSWDDVQVYIDKLNAKTGIKFCLPTEAEWEYAAHGGHKSSYKEGNGQVHIGKYKYAGSNNLNEVGWYIKNSKTKTHPVGTKKPNELGICDMSGNVWEWCQDRWHYNYIGAPTDGSVWETGDSSYRVLRGGSWDGDGQNCRSANRNNNGPDKRNNNIGFRLVFVP